MAPSMLIGHSLGGAAMLKAAANLGQIKAVVTLGAPADPSHVVHNFGTSLDEIAVNGKAEVTLAGRPFTISHDFVQDVAATELEGCLAKLKVALLVLHSPIDQTVGIENTSQIFVAAKHPKSFVTLDHADHLISDVDDAEYAADVIAAWAKRYLPASPLPIMMCQRACCACQRRTLTGFSKTSGRATITPRLRMSRFHLAAPTRV
jgi:putative redox protein